MIIELSPRTLYPLDISPKNCPNMLISRFMTTSHQFQFSLAVAKLFFPQIDAKMKVDDLKNQGYKINFFIEGHQMYIAKSIYSGFRIMAGSYGEVGKGTIYVSSPSLLHSLKDVCPIENRSLWIVDDSPISINEHQCYRLLKFDPSIHASPVMDAKIRKSH